MLARFESRANEQLHHAESELKKAAMGIVHDAEAAIEAKAKAELDKVRQIEQRVENVVEAVKKETGEISSALQGAEEKAEEEVESYATAAGGTGEGYSSDEKKGLAPPKPKPKKKTFKK
jgi:uncharacterized protein (DUF305 family)